MPAKRATSTRLRSDFAKRITAAWRKTIHDILAVGRLLIQAKDELKGQKGQFSAMVENDLPFGVRYAEMFMSIARHPRLSNPNMCSHLPAGLRALYELSRLSVRHFHEALAAGKIHPDMTVEDARRLADIAEWETQQRQASSEAAVEDAPNDAEEQQHVYEVVDQSGGRRRFTVRSRDATVKRTLTYTRGPTLRTRLIPEDMERGIAERERADVILDALCAAAEADVDVDVMFDRLTQHRSDDVEKVKRVIDNLRRLGERLDEATVVSLKPR